MKSIKEIQETVALHFGISVEAMTSPCRQRELTMPRQVSYYLCDLAGHKSRKEIEAKHNRKQGCHNSFKVVINEISYNEKLRSDVDELKEKLGIETSEDAMKRMKAEVAKELMDIAKKLCSTNVAYSRSNIEMAAIKLIDL